jgi:hypothetical protein
LLTLECLLGGEGVFDRKAAEDDAGCNEPFIWKEDDDVEKFPPPTPTPTPVIDPEDVVVGLLLEEE